MSAERRRSRVVPLRLGVLLAWLGAIGWLGTGTAHGQGTEPVVRAVLFYSPTCPHCEQLIRETLPPILQRYGDRLNMVGVNVATPSGASAYQATIEHFLIPSSRQGVPTLVVGERVLVGGLEIPSELAGIIDAGLSAGGIDWPDIAVMRSTLLAQGLIQPEPVPPPSPAQAISDSAVTQDTVPPIAPDTVVADSVVRSDEDSAESADSLAAAEPDVSPAGPGPDLARPDPASERELAPPAEGDTAGREEGGSEPAASETVPDEGIVPAPVRGLDLDVPAMTMLDRFRLDPVGNSVSVAVLVLLGAVLLWVLVGLFSARNRPPPLPAWLLPALAIAGMAVAAYLAWVETTGAEAVCGPVGDCNTVQQSEYARLLGIPIGLLGLLGYTAILAAWVLSRDPGPARRGGRLAAWSMAMVATLFSWYLTFLEPFVIGATCAWCLSSAVIAALLLLATTPGAYDEIRPIRESGA